MREREGLFKNFGIEVTQNDSKVIGRKGVPSRGKVIPEKVLLRIRSIRVWSVGNRNMPVRCASNGADKNT